MWGVNFESEQFWDKFHQEESSFEWYGENADLESLIGLSTDNQFRESCRTIVNVGCGTAATPQILNKIFSKSILIDNVDYSEVALDLLKEKYKKLPERVKWTRLDISNGAMLEHYGSKSVDLIIDKGFMDSYLSRPNESEDTIKLLADDYLTSCVNILKENGKFIIITLAEPRIVKAISKYFFKRKDLKYNIIPFTLNKKHDEEKTTASNGCILEPYCIVVSPLNKSNDPVYRVSQLPGDNSATLLGSFEMNGKSFLPFIRLSKELPKIRFLHHVSTSWDVGVRRTIEYASNSGNKYEVGIYDSLKGKPPTNTRPLKTAAVLVPKGSEYDWTFVSNKGNEILALQLGVSRLLTVISFSGEPDHEDIGGFLPSLSPTSRNFPIAVVPPAETDSSDLILYQEDGLIAKESGDHTSRSLMFAALPQLVQSEVAILDGHFDFMDLRSAYYKLIIIAGVIPTLLQSKHVRIGIIGTGAGCLDMAIVHLTDAVRVTDESTDIFVESVEIDERIVDIGKDYFGLSESEGHHQISVRDGYDWVSSVSDGSMNVLIIDAGGNDVTDPVRLPAPSLRSMEFMKIVLDKLTKDGQLLVNYVSRDGSCIFDYVHILKSVGFGSIYSITDSDEINQIIVARKEGNTVITVESIKDNLKAFESNYELLSNSLKDLNKVSIQAWK